MSLGHSPSIVTNGLVLYLDAGNVKSYPGTGTAVTDLVGSGVVGTLTGGPTYNSVNGGGFVCDGTNDCIALPAGTMVGTGTSPLTVSLWFKQTKDFTAGQYIMPIRVQQTSEFFIVFYRASTTLHAYSVFRGSTQWGTPLTQSDYVNKWLHFVAVYTGGVKDTAASYVNYCNGAALATGSVSYGAAGGTEYNANQINGDTVNTGAAGYYPGTMSVVQLYSRALSAAEVAQNFNALRGRFGI